MSLVYITYHNENIFDVENNRASHVDGERCTYISKFRKLVRKQSKQPHVIELEQGKKILTDSKKCKHKTMGYAETPLDPPCAFLRKNQGIKWRRMKDHVCPKPIGMDPVPRYERPKSAKPKETPKKEVAVEKINVHCPHPRYFKGHKHRANFVAVNVERIKSSKPKRHPPCYVDTPVGDRHNLLNTGLVPQYICGKNYGKVPCYLTAQKKMLQDIREKCKAAEEQQERKCVTTFLSPGVRRLTANERYEILAGLKENFQELNKVYQRLSLYTDTIAKKLRKGKLEKDLRQMEQDILLIESNPVMFVSEY